MEALVEEASVGHSSALERHSPTSASSETVTNRVNTSVAQVRANGTVVFTHPTTVKNVSLLKEGDIKVVSGSNSTTQAIAVPQPGGAVSIVHVSIPNQQVHVQSVIQQPNQQSVIQAPSGTIQGLSKNVILLNKVTNQGSVIHSADGETGIHPVQLITASKGDSDGETVTGLTPEDESKKRREILARRPSYRKILSELSSTETHSSVGNLTATSGEIKEDASSSVDDQDVGTITVAGTQYHTAAGLLKVVPASAIQLSTSGQEANLQGLQTLTMSNSSTGASIVQYAQGQDGQFFVPVTVSAADLQAYQIRTTSGNGNGNLSQSVVMTPSNNIQSQQQIVEEASRKRELRLLKNREAAKECRRKKKEYIKCLENRVAVLENQNKALIEELKSLKELYCQKAD